jgi:TolB-like protein/DNA-binding winged helix-turn-helix (wHTH) protein/Tfp pilus assembly protein PilF
MADQTPAHSRVRFGVFELDLQAGELRKSGVLLHLPPQPFKVLTLLANRPAELVTREEIRNQVWGVDTFVDFEHGLNFAIKKIRDTLGDDPETPRYIETLPRRGYRFIAPVEVVAGLVHAQGPDGAAAARAGRPPGVSLQRRWIVAAVSGAVVVIAAVLFALNVGSLRDRLLTALDLKSAAPPGIESIAVLPLENLSRDPEQEYFAGGLTDALITDLGKMITLRVISRTSVMQYKGTKKPLPQIARELNVDAVVEGTIQRFGNRIRITAQLLHARTDRHLWAETYERDYEDVIRLERQIAVAIAHEVTGRLTPAQETRLARKTTTNPRAYDSYLRGRYLFGQRLPEPTAAAVGYFQQALKEDPQFALAYSGLADCYGVAWFVKVDLPLAEKYARKALELEPDLAEAHASLGIVDTAGGKFADAEKELRRALDLNPNYVMAHHWWSFQLLYFGRLEEALAENGRARQLDPFSLPVNHLRVIILTGLRQYDRAIEQAEREAEIDPQLSAPHVLSARIYWVEGRVPDAIAEERKAATLLHLPARQRDLDEVAAAFAGSGLRAAQVKSAQLKEKGYKGVYSASDIALQYGVVGDKGKVLGWLNQAFRDNDDAFVQIAITAPAFDCVRSDPRFHDLLRRLGLEQ